MTSISSADFSTWIGRHEQADDVVTARLVREFSATFDPYLAKSEINEAPFLIHWCLAPPAAGLDELGVDGHPKRGGFLPPISLPRRMWAGGEVTFLDDLHIGDQVTRTSSIASIERKNGKSGELWFVNVAHEIATVRGVAIKEVQTLVYRGTNAVQRGGPEPCVTNEDAEWQEKVQTSTVRLFRYSSLTFNGHRIHYDEPYATEIESYAGLVIHGPLQATLLAHLAARLHGRRPAHFQYRGLSPLIAGEPVEIRAKTTAAGAHCCVCDSNDRMTMEATATW